MLAKLIVCDVDPRQRDDFAAAQRCWSGLAGADGFHGQCGGWDAARRSAAVILGWWASRGQYNRFMRELHDPIVAATRQTETYRSIETSLWESLLDMPGECDNWTTRMTAAGLIRIARCNVRAGREDHFVQIQQRHWRPAMAAVPGMLGGVFSRAVSTPRDYIVCTFWRSVNAHRDYVQDHLPALRAASGVEQDCESLTGTHMAVERDWVVTPRSAANPPGGS